MRPLTPATAELVDLLHGGGGRIAHLLRIPTSRVKLIRRIGEQGELGAVPWLAPLLLERTSEGVAAQLAVARLLQNCPDEELLDLDEVLRDRGPWWMWKEWRGIRPEEVTTVGLAPGTVAAVLGVLSCHSSGYVRERVVRRLGRLGSGDEVPYLLIRLNDWVAPVRQAARESLLARLARGAVQSLLEHLPLVLRLQKCGREDHQQIVEGVLSALWRPEAALHFEQALTDTSPHLRRAVYRAALASEPEQCRRAIALALPHADPVLRLWALRDAVGHFPEELLSAALLRARFDRFPAVRRESLLAYVTRFPEEAPAVLRSGLFDDNGGVRGLSQYYWKKLGGPPAAPLYLDRLSKGVATVGAVAGLGETGTHDDVIFALALLRSDSPRLRSAAIAATARLGETDDLKKIVPRLEDKSPRVIATAAKCLAAHPEAIDVGELMEIFRRHHRPQVVRAIFALLQSRSTWTTLPAFIEMMAVAEESIAENVRNYVVAQSSHVFTSPTTEQREAIDAAFTKFGMALDAQLVRETRKWIEFRAN